MAKDDYFVLVYKILSYLYAVLKEGRPPEEKLLRHDSPLLGVNEVYWAYIMEHLVQDGFVSGLIITPAWGGAKVVSELDHCQITPDGIAYLMENSLLAKARELLKDVKAMTQFI